MIAAVLAAALTHICPLSSCDLSNPGIIENTGIETNFITYPKPGEVMLNDPVIAEAYDQAHKDPWAFCAALRMVGYMQISRGWQAQYEPENDKAIFNIQELVCPRDLTKSPVWKPH